MRVGASTESTIGKKMDYGKGPYGKGNETRWIFKQTFLDSRKNISNADSF
jgi:hypothetical protein